MRANRRRLRGERAVGSTQGGSRALAGDGGSPLARQGEWPGGDPDRLPGLAAVACPPQRSGVGSRNREAETGERKSKFSGDPTESFIARAGRQLRQYLPASSVARNTVPLVSRQCS